MKRLNSLKIMINNSANTTLSIIKRSNNEDDKLTSTQKLKQVSYGLKVNCKEITKISGFWLVHLL